ncbi:DUF1642 domain-containing protein, partial [Streptococcus suis]|uniref:DUF1642 domain-containing protein n=1 Tax=Streptococcus suis TaxID=1307 RepID=UPI000CF436A6
MNKQEAINQIKLLKARETFMSNTIWVKQGDTIDIISQIHEPQKVVVPKFIADKIEYCKNAEGYGLFHAMDYCFNYKDSADWLECNQETFAHAWLDGYEVEKEKLYIVEFPTGQQLYKNYPSGSSKKQIVIKFANPKDKDGHFIKWELEKAGFGWVFDCNGVKVVEVDDER